MESSENSSWSQIRQRVLAAGNPSQQREIRFWASRKRAMKSICIIGEEVRASAERAPEVKRGECGVCRHRYLRLAIQPAEFKKSSEQIAFGALYKVEEISTNGSWIRIRINHSGHSGWIESRSHFPISPGEHKVLASLKRTNTLNFLINALAAL